MSDLVVISAEGEEVRVEKDVAPGGVDWVLVARPTERTAVARVLAGLAEPASGEIWVGDREVTHERPSRRQIGYVPAGGVLLPHLTVRDNIRYGLSRRERVPASDSHWFNRLVRSLELESLLDQRPHQLTDAQTLRVAIARATVTLSEALVIDLATGLDPTVLRDLVARATPRDSHGIATLVCSTPDPNQPENPRPSGDGAT